MKEWVYLTLITCAYGGFKALHPTTHFLTQYLEGPCVNLTHTQVNNQVYPVWTYSYLCFLPIIFVTTVYVRQKPIIILESVSLTLTWVFLIWLKPLWAIQLMQVIFGLATACEVGYDTYLYAKVPREKYRKVTSYTRAAVLTGRLLSAGSAQILISTSVLDFGSLNYISLSFSICATIVAFCLPRTSTTNFSIDAPITGPNIEPRHNSNAANPEISDVLTEQPIAKEKWSVTRRLWSGIRTAYSDKSLVQWSIWWALGTCGSLQVGNYIQTLWEEIYPLVEHKIAYNGAVDAIKTLLATFVTLLLGHLKIDWNKYGEITMALAAGVEACVLLIMSDTSYILVAYITYCIFHSCHQMLMTIASYQVAKGLSQMSQPLIFGCNTFLALICQTILTAIVVDRRSLGLTPRLQFEVYSGYFAFISGLFWTFSIAKFARFAWTKSNQQPTSDVVF